MTAKTHIDQELKKKQKPKNIKTNQIKKNFKIAQLLDRKISLGSLHVTHKEQ